jgi:hypothetical protein
MVYFMLAYILVWYGGSLVAISYFGVTAVEALGIGTAGGVFLSMVKDAWQFLWRQAPKNTDKPPEK